MHPGYVQSEHDAPKDSSASNAEPHDIALLIIDGHFQFGYEASPACLPYVFFSPKKNSMFLFL